MPPRVAARAWTQLNAQDRDWLTRLAGLAAQSSGGQARVALVGGAVRDALLSVTPLDLDVVLDGADVATVAGALGQPFTFHPAFRNATVTLPDGRSADLVQARRETYPQPGANPVPQPAALEDDLRRRDFSLNALALQVTPAGKPALLDAVDGLTDLRARRLRPLHAQSLREDASRLIRAARLGARLDLHASPELLAQVPDALAVAAVTPRLWAELKLLLQEPRPGRAARVLSDWHAGELLPGLKLLEALDAQRDAGAAVPWAVYAAAVLAASEAPAPLAARLGLGDRPGALLARAMSDTFFPDGAPERTLRALLRPDAYLPLTGRDVLARGVPPGQAVGAALSHLAALRRTGQLHSRQDEQAALEKYLTLSQGR